MTAKEARSVWEMIKEDVIKELKEEGFMVFAGHNGYDRRSGKTHKDLVKEKTNKK